MKLVIDGNTLDIALSAARQLELSKFDQVPNGAGAFFTVVVDGRHLRGHIGPISDGYRIWLAGRTIDVRKPTTGTSSSTSNETGLGPICAPYACKLLAVLVSADEIVEKGAALFRIESMKMEQEITATCRAKVVAIEKKAGTSLARGDVIVRLAEIDD